MVSRFLRTALCSVALLGFAATSAISATMNYLGKWLNSTSYTTGSVITYNNVIYYSLKSSKSAPNKNYAPDVSPNWWQPLGNTSISVVDATGKFMGSLIDQESMWFNTPDGAIVMRFASPLGFAYPYNMLYETLDCSGQAYMPAFNDNGTASLFPVGAVRNADGTIAADGVPVSGTLYYAAEPMALKETNSILDGDGVCTADTSTSWIGTAKSMTVSWTYPLKVKR